MSSVASAAGLIHLGMDTAALNLRNLLGKGLTRRDGAWVLAT